MNIFQFFQALPSDFWENLLISVIGAIIGSGGAILIFYLTIGHDRKKEAERKELHCKNKLRYFHSLVESVIDSVEKQILNMREFTEKVKKNPFEYNYLNIVVNENITRISERVDQEELYHSYLQIICQGKEEHEFLQSLNVVDYLNAALKSTKDSLFQTTTYTSELEKQYSALSERLLDEAGSELNSIKTTDPTGYAKKDFFIFLNTSILSYYNGIQDEQTIQLRESKFIQPFKLGLMSTFRAIPISDKWLTMCKDCTHLYSEIAIRYTEIANDIERDAVEMETRLPILRKINETINTVLQNFAKRNKSNG